MPDPGETHDEFAARIEEMFRSIEGGADPLDEARAMGGWMISTLTPEQAVEIHRQIEEKEVLRRFTELTDLLNELVFTEKRLVVGETLEQRVSQYEALVEHVLALWKDARLLFESGRFATATFLAIACMEEVGKVGVARWQMYVPEHGTGQTQDRRRRSALYSHPQKHVLAAAQGALINARLDRLLGFGRVKLFLDDVEARRVEELRQTCLYVDHDGQVPLLPDARVSDATALFYVALAGEMMAEVLGAEPGRWRALLDEAIDFERAHGIALPEDALTT